MARTLKHTKDLIQAGSIARITSKSTGKFLGFLVKSNSNNDYYQVTCTKIAGECVWSCNCKAGQNGFVNCTPDADGNRYCCHIRACIEVCKAHKAHKAAEKKQAEQGEAEVKRATQHDRIQAEAQAIITKRFTELEKQREMACKSGSFSFLR